MEGLIWRGVLHGYIDLPYDEPCKCSHHTTAPFNCCPCFSTIQAAWRWEPHRLEHRRRDTSESRSSIFYCYIYVDVFLNMFQPKQYKNSTIYFSFSRQYAWYQQKASLSCINTACLSHLSHLGSGNVDILVISGARILSS